MTSSVTGTRLLAPHFGQVLARRERLVGELCRDEDIEDLLTMLLPDGALRIHPGARKCRALDDVQMFPRSTSPRRPRAEHLLVNALMQPHMDAVVERHTAVIDVPPLVVRVGEAVDAARKQLQAEKRKRVERPLTDGA